MHRCSWKTYVGGSGTYALIVYDCDTTGKSHLLMINNALLVLSLTCCLINPFIMWIAGLHVNGCPKFLTPLPTESNHSIYFLDEDLRIPLTLEGIISYIPCQSPLPDEILDSDSFLPLTPRSNTWDPHVSTYSSQEESMMNYQGEVKNPPRRQFIVSKILSRTMDPTTFVHDLVSSVCDNSFSSHHVAAVKSVNGVDTGLDPVTLSKTWNIGLETAKRTIQQTTRLCPRNTIPLLP